MDNSVIAYSVNKTNYKGVYISVQNGEVSVQAPWYVTKSKIQYEVLKKRNWILKKLKEYKAEMDIELKPIKILGVIYNLKIVYKNISVIECNLQNAILNAFRHF